jgi:hypothetical protein
MTNTYDSLGETLRHDRLASGLRLNDVLQILYNKYKIDISIASLQRLETDQRQLTIMEAIALSNIYKVDFNNYKRAIEYELFKKMI